MKQFSLEEYLKNPDRKVVTRNGLPVRIICTDRKQERHIIALIKERNDTETICAYNTQGKFWTNDECSNLDLMFAPTKKEGWVNIFESTKGYKYCYKSIFPSEKEARWAGEPYKTYIATVKVEWEE